MRHLKHAIPAAAFALSLVMGSAMPVAAAAGDLDTTFNGTGTVNLEFGPTGNFWFIDVAIQPADQKIVAVGTQDRGRAFGNERWLIVRLNTDGTLDNSFGGGDGFVTLGWSKDDDWVNAMALQADGKIVVVGRGGGPVKRWAIARFTTTGMLDATFGGDGKVGLDLTSGSENQSGLDEAVDVAIQQDQKIVVTGFTGAVDSRFMVARFRANGKLDATFSGDGIATANLSPRIDLARSVSIDSFGRIVVAGTADIPLPNTPPQPGYSIGLARFRPNGTLDTNFSGDGKVLTNMTTGYDSAWAVEIQPADNKIVVTGEVGRDNRDTRIAALRYNANGTPDRSFNGDGRVAFDISSEPFFATDDGRGIAIQDDGKIVLSGNAAGGEVLVLMRLTSTGRLDVSFGDGGIVLGDFSTTADPAFGVAIQADGAIVTAGYSQNGPVFVFLKATVARFLGS